MHSRIESYYGDPVSQCTRRGILLGQNFPPPVPPPTSSIPSRPNSRFNQVNLNRSRRLNKALLLGTQKQMKIKHESDDMRQIGALNRRLASLTIADMSPGLALRRITCLYDRGEYREAAAFVRRLTQPTFRQLLPNLPMEIYMEAMPHSLPLLEAVYAKLFVGNQPQGLTVKMMPEHIMWQIIRFFSSYSSNEPNRCGSGRWEMCGPWVSTCKRLLNVLLTAEPKLKRIVLERRWAITRSIEGLGQHGVVAATLTDKPGASLMSLHDALKHQINKVQKTFLEAISKLDSHYKALHKTSSSGITMTSSLSSSSGHKHSSPPIAQSHQRQLSLRIEDIQERLLKNKTLLSVVTPTLENDNLQVLIAILHRRIELDNEVIFQFSSLRREGHVGVMDPADAKNPSIAPLLMRYQRGCQQVLDLIKDISEDETASDEADVLSGYQTDTDTTIMMSGNSPFISKDVRNNFLSRSARFRGKKFESQMTQAKIESKVHPISSGSTSSGISSHCSCSSEASSHDSDEDLSAVCVSGPKPIIETSANNISTIIVNTGQKPNSNRIFNRVLKPNGVKRTTNYQDESGISTKSCENCNYVKSSYTMKQKSTVKPTQSENDNWTQDQMHASYSSTADASESMSTAAMHLRNEVIKLSCELDQANKKISNMTKQEQHLTRRIADLLIRNPVLETDAGSCYVVSQGDRRPASLIRQFGELYSLARLDALDALDTLVELEDAEELKTKIIFSVIVLSFRMASSNATRIHEMVQRSLQLSYVQEENENLEFVREFKAALSTYMRRTADSFDLSKLFEEVTAQIWATLYDYPSLKKCAQLKNFISKCMRVAWGLVNQTPEYVIEYEARKFASDVHVRYHTSDVSKISIKTYLWPALCEGPGGPCVYKGVVIT